MSYPLGVKKAVVLSLRLFSLKRSTAGDLAVPLRGEKIQATPTKPDIASLGFISKFSMGAPPSFLYGSPPSFFHTISSLNLGLNY